MIELACHYGEGPVELREIASRENISLKYLEQVIVPLRTAGLVKAVRGSKGGYSLAKAPSEIHLNDLVEILDGPLNLIECLSDPKSCQKVSSCVTRDIWKEVSGAIHGIFGAITLEDMVNRRKMKEEGNPLMYQI